MTLLLFVLEETARLANSIGSLENAEDLIVICTPALLPTPSDVPKLILVMNLTASGLTV